MPFMARLPDRRVDGPDGSFLSLVALAETDLPLIRRWLGTPHVARWWGPLETEIPEIRAHLTSDTVTPFLMVEAGRPIGYLQIYHANGDPFWADHDLPRETFGLDLSFGEPDALGRGLGPRFIQIALDRLFAVPEIRRVHIDPDPANHVAIRAYEKTGFRRAGLIDTPDGRALYMTLDRDVYSSASRSR